MTTTTTTTTTTTIDQTSAPWVSTAMTGSGPWVPCEATFGLDDIKLISEMGRRHQSGHAISAEFMPTSLYFKEKARAIPGVFVNSGFFFVSGAVAAVLREFDLGEGGFVPVPIYLKDRKTRVDGEWFCLNFGCVKTTFVPALSRCARLGPEMWNLGVDRGDGRVALSAAALEGPDLWFEEKIKRAFFISSRLAAALRAARVNKPFGLLRCVLEDTP